MKNNLFTTCGLVGAMMAGAVTLSLGTAHAGPLGGVWSLSDVLSSQSCKLDLMPEASASGLGNALELHGCELIYAPLAKVSAWTWGEENGLFLLADDGDVVAQFDIDELDGLTSVRPSNMFMIMQPQQDLALSELIPKAGIVTAQR